jgi:hypothetical protein
MSTDYEFNGWVAHDKVSLIESLIFPLTPQPESSRQLEVGKVYTENMDRNRC